MPIYHRSGKPQEVVKGIALLTLLWTEGQALIPCDFRVYDKPWDGNNPFRPMLQEAKRRGLASEYVLMMRLKDKRLVNPDGEGNVPMGEVETPEGRWYA